MLNGPNMEEPLSEDGGRLPLVFLQEVVCPAQGPRHDLLMHPQGWRVEISRDLLTPRSCVIRHDPPC